MNGNRFIKITMLILQTSLTADQRREKWHLVKNITAHYEQY